MKPQTRAVNVLEKTSEYLRAGLVDKQPAWYNVVGQTPPIKNFIRQPRFEHPIKEKVVTPPKKGDINFNGRKTKLYKTSHHEQKRDVYNIPKLKFVEDQLRQLFYEQHPWELARPRILLENTGEDIKNQDWSSIIQINKPLDGESVVQRTLYLLNNTKGLDFKKAYDTARHEYYRVRIQLQIEEQVAKEQNEMFGAGYDLSLFESGVEKEQAVIDKWKQDAVEGTQLMEAKNVSPQAAWSGESTTEGKPTTTTTKN
ncbi:37S ribosomal protein S25, mitochondrial [Wickerhamomyces ciferrii]|uniref:37S ribosomal protein S25, mitochondrial n=1 Tax=Wickerhamomyces ciferrii (strain ATCC 14091 / BCRC 22168 / CBS 111 / JCM 3599 / NBRC 0793 / NRRL Y-1031 F-60-10) TaxID=1206466 RepID=K0KEX3_WICCF|nr:37S ribosomal protein S25, mitochondrial [Wickerhamomyces ciferrii]CCH41501.1 37S ribosomal protein S25, mitochondrial [Wickerhamomyces ciferrii]